MEFIFTCNLAFLEEIFRAKALPVHKDGGLQGYCCMLGN